ncbi:hypothetical protein IFM53868_11018, partial [Aspergillus udagawae]
IGDYPGQGDHPVITCSTKPSFLCWEEYVTLLGYSLIYKHEYVEGLVKGLADAITTLKVVEIPRAGSRQYIGFLELPNEFSLDLQPGDAMKLNFNAIIILLTWPWDKDKREWVRFDDDLEPSVIDVAVNVLFSNKTFCWQIAALQELQDINAYQTIAEDFSALIHQFQFNAAQQAAFICLRALPAPSNDVVNDLAVRIKEAQLQFIPDRETIVVRCHALCTEEDLLLMPAKKQRPRPANACPPIIAEDDLTHDDGLLAQTAQPLGVKDHWVKQVELSIGYQMLQLSGIIPAPWLTPVEFISFREHYRLYRAGEEFDDEIWKDFYTRSWELRDAVLARVDAIIYTLHAVGEQAMRDNVQPQAILVDEAARATEPELWPMLAFFNPNAFVLIGNHHQLRPLVLSSPKQNPLMDQL